MKSVRPATRLVTFPLFSSKLPFRFLSGVPFFLFSFAVCLLASNNTNNRSGAGKINSAFAMLVSTTFSTTFIAVKASANASCADPFSRISYPKII